MIFGGAFKPSSPLLVGHFRFANKRFNLTQGQKRRVRNRLREVDSVLDTLLQSNVPFKSQQEAISIPREPMLSPKEKYYVFSRDPKRHMKPITQGLLKCYYLIIDSLLSHLLILNRCIVPHFTKAPHPRGFPPGY